MPKQNWEKEFEMKFGGLKIPCSCPKGGKYGDRICDKCDGFEWIFPEGLEDFIKSQKELSYKQGVKETLDKIEEIEIEKLGGFDLIKAIKFKQKVDGDNKDIQFGYEQSLSLIKNWFVQAIDDLNKLKKSITNKL